MTLHIISLPGIEKARFALGLDWRHFDTRPSNKDLRVFGAERGSWVAVRHSIDDAWQAGFASPPQKASHLNLYALAAIVADSRPQPWRAVFKLDDELYWYIAVRDDHEIIPDGDFVGSREEVASVREQHSFYGAWNEPDGTLDLAAIAEIVKGYTNKKPAVKSLARPSWLFPAVVGGVIVAVAVGGGVAWHLRQKEIEKARIAELARKKALEAAMKKQEVKNIVPPWVQQPDPDRALAQCGLLWSKQPLSAAGWVLSKWSCQIQPRQITATASFVRAGGVAAFAPGNLNAGGEESTQSTTAELKNAAGQNYVLPSADARRAFWSLMQSIGLKGTLNEAPVRNVLPGAPNTPPEDPWVSQGVQVALPAPPWALGLSFNLSIPGLRVSSIEISQNEWKLTGQLFSSRITVQPSTSPSPIETSRGK